MLVVRVLVAELVEALVQARVPVRARVPLLALPWALLVPAQPYLAERSREPTVRRRLLQYFRGSIERQQINPRKVQREHIAPG